MELESHLSVSVGQRDSLGKTQDGVSFEVGGKKAEVPGQVTRERRSAWEIGLDLTRGH